MTSFSEANAEALQASPPNTNPCPKGYVVDRYNNNECVKRFVSITNNIIQAMHVIYYFGILYYINITTIYT